MKFFAKVRKRPGLVFFALSYLAFLVFLMGNVVPRYPLWRALPEPPEPIEKLFHISGGNIVVITRSGNTFSCNIYDLKECWVVDPYNRQEWVQQCGEDFMSLKHEVLSTKHTVQTAQSCTTLHAFAESVTAYSLNDDGLIYVKQMGWITLFGYYLGAVFSTIGTVLLLLVKNAVTDVIVTLQAHDSK